MNWLERFHSTRVHTRRVRILAAAAAPLLPANARVLDVGCGDGRVAAEIGRHRADVSFVGVEVAPRAGCLIPVTPFDGNHLPFPDGSFDATVIVDVLHHTEDPAPLLREAARVSRDAVLLKDHLREGCCAQATLRFMDELGNRRHGVPLPNRYLSAKEWARLFADCSLVTVSSDPLRSLYPFPANLIFGRGLHFLVRLKKRPAA
ncbi:MAG: methyltransferase domain-containing protein [Opitutaceae bacterium]